MAQNITLLGASYSDCPAILLPKTGGGTARFDDASVTTATASDVASGKIFLASDGAITTGTNSGGGGGASNIVTGTFKGTTTGAAMDVTLNYSGSGYPIVAVIYPKDGVYKNGTTFYNLVQRYAINYYLMIKSDPTIAPKYEDNSGYDLITNYVRYKSSSSSSGTYGGSANFNISMFSQNDASSSNSSNVLKIKAKDKMSVFIASSSYGFVANIEYTYHVIYSS